MRNIPEGLPPECCAQVIAMKQKEKSKKEASTPIQRITVRCLMCQCLAVGGWLMLLLIKFGIGFPLSGEIGKCAIYVTAAFLLGGIAAIFIWDKKLVQLRPEAVCLKDSSEMAHHLHKVLFAVAGAAVACMLAAVVLIFAFQIKTTEEPVNRCLTNWPLYVLTGSWLGFLSYFVYDAVTLKLWLRSEEEQEPAPEEAGEAAEPVG